MPVCVVKIAKENVTRRCQAALSVSGEYGFCIWYRNPKCHLLQPLANRVFAAFVKLASMIIDLFHQYVTRKHRRMHSRLITLKTPSFKNCWTLHEKISLQFTFALCNHGLHSFRRKDYLANSPTRGMTQVSTSRSSPSLFYSSTPNHYY